MSYETVKISDGNGTVFQLPKGLSFQTFNWDRTAAILKEGIGGPFKNGAGVIDSFDFRKPPEGKTPVEAVKDLLIRHGAKPITPNGAVA